jgi:hypothetical protein
MKPINYIPSPSSPPFTLPLPTSTSHTLCTYFTVLPFIINSRDNVQRDFLMYPLSESIFLWSIQPLPLLTPSLSPPIIQQLSIHILISSTCTDVIYFSTVDCLSRMYILTMLSLPHLAYCISLHLFWPSLISFSYVLLCLV